MTTAPSSWYLPGEGNKPNGPFTTEQIIQAWQTGKLNKKTLCWREGMEQWLPLVQVEPFAATLRSTTAKRWSRRMLRWLAIRAAILVCPVIVVGMLYITWKEATTIRRANTLIAAGDYDEAVTLLSPIADDAYFYRHEAEYLSTLATLREYASSANPRDISADALKKPKKQLRGLFRDREQWQDRAKSDVAGILGSIPQDAPDTLARSKIIAGFLEELKLSEGKQLAKELLAGLTAWSDRHQGPEGIDAGFVANVLRLDPALTEATLTLVLGESAESSLSIQTKLAVVQRWAHDQSALAKLFATGLLERADTSATGGKYDLADGLVATAERLCPNERERYVRKRLAWMKSRMADRDYFGVVRCLNAMQIESCGDAIFAEAAALYLQIAQATRKTSPVTAEPAVDRAFQLDPRLTDSEANSLLWIDLHPQPNDEKLRRCQQFLSSFPKSEHSLDVQASVFAIAKRLAGEGRTDEAIRIAESIRNANSETPLKQDIDRRIAEWQKQPPLAARSPNGDPITLTEKLLRCKLTINTSTAIHDAVNNKDICIIEVADTCTVDQFDAEQARILKKWVSAGGVLWVNSSVLSMFDIGYSKLRRNRVDCVPAGASHPILEGSKKVQLDDCDAKSHTLQHRNVVPLLASAKSGGWNDHVAGTTAWSLVRYGKGWISDPKPINLREADGALFWARFCQFCLHELPWPSPTNDESPFETQRSKPEKGYLDGLWQVGSGAQFRFQDNGHRVDISLVRSTKLTYFSGTISRDKSNPRRLDGSFVITFAKQEKRYTCSGTLILPEIDAGEDIKTSKISFRDWPITEKGDKGPKTFDFRRVGMPGEAAGTAGHGFGGIAEVEDEL